MGKKYYLAYGSNLNLKQMSVRCPNSKVIGTIKLDNYKLVYKGSCKNYAYLTIEKSEGDFIPLGLFEVSDLDIHSLDKYEGYPDFYSKFYIPINMNNENIYALIYVMNDEFNYNIPTKNYIQVCMEGYEDFGFDKSILEKALKDTIENMPQKIKK